MRCENMHYLNRKENVYINVKKGFSSLFTKQFGEYPDGLSVSNKDRIYPYRLYTHTHTHTHIYIYIYVCKRKYT